MQPLAHGMPFIKMHGLGNDFVVVDAVAAPELALRVLPELVRRLCDRTSGEGIGADGVIVFSRQDGAPAMRILNSDGTDGGMCGNGARCIARLAVERGYAREGEPFELLVGARRVRVMARRESVQNWSVSVEMGQATFEPASVPVMADRLERAAEVAGVPVFWFAVGGERCRGVCVNVGNPHVVLFMRTPVRDIDAAGEGAAIEHHAAFPSRTNVQFVNVKGPDQAEVRTWERGAGLTRACGSGACAVLAAGVALGELRPSATVSMPGGALRVERREDGQIVKTGPAARVFEGLWQG